MLHQGEQDENKMRQAIDTSREQLAELDIKQLSSQEISAFQVTITSQRKSLKIRA